MQQFFRKSANTVCRPARKVSTMTTPTHRPLLYATTVDHGTGETISLHHHPFMQLTLPLQGTVKLQLEQGWWLATPGTGILVAAGVEHRAIYPRTSRLINVHFSLDSTENAPPAAQMVNVSEMLMALGHELQTLAARKTHNAPLEAMRQVLIYQLRQNVIETDLFMPEGTDRRLQKVIYTLRSNPGCTDSLAVLAQSSGTSQRTLARLFEKETGMTFLRWRERLRMMVAIERMMSGQSIVETALDLGYQSASSFTTAFTRLVGIPPGKYVKDAAHKQPGKAEITISDGIA